MSMVTTVISLAQHSLSKGPGGTITQREKQRRGILEL